MLKMKAGHRPLDIDDDDLYEVDHAPAPVTDDDEDDDEDEDEVQQHEHLEHYEQGDDEDEEDEDASRPRRAPVRPRMSTSPNEPPPLAGVGDMIDPDEAASEEALEEGSRENIEAPVTDDRSGEGSIEAITPESPRTLDTPDDPLLNLVVIGDDYSVPSEAIRATRHAEGRAYISDDGTEESWMDMYGVDEDYARMVRDTLAAVGENYHDDD